MKRFLVILILSCVTSKGAGLVNGTISANPGTSGGGGGSGATNLTGAITGSGTGSIVTSLGSAAGTNDARALNFTGVVTAPNAGNSFSASNVFVGNTFTSPRTEANISQSLKNVPWCGVDTYYPYNTGGNNSYSSEMHVLQIATNLIGSGLYNYGYNVVLIDTGWNYGRLPNGQLTYTTNQFPNGVASVIARLHTNGFKAYLFYGEIGGNGTGGTNLVSPIVPIFSNTPIASVDFSNDMSLFASWKIDGLVFAENTGAYPGGDPVVRANMENCSYWARKILPSISFTLVDQASTNVDYVYAFPSNIAGTDPVNGLPVNSNLNPGRFFPWEVSDCDYLNADMEWLAANSFLDGFINHFVLSQNLAGFWNANRHPFLNVMQGWFSSANVFDTVQGRQQMSLWALAHSPFIIGDAWDFWGTRGTSLTNAACLKIQTDPAYNNIIWLAPLSFYNGGTNRFGTNVDVGIEPLSDGSSALLVHNYSTNLIETVTVPLVNTNYSTNVFNGSLSGWMGTNNQQYLEQDAWNGDITETYTTFAPPHNTIVSNAITMTIGTNDCFLVMLYPIPATGANVFQVGYTTITTGVVPYANIVPNVLTNNWAGSGVVVTNSISSYVATAAPNVLKVLGGTASSASTSEIRLQPLQFTGSEGLAMGMFWSTISGGFLSDIATGDEYIDGYDTGHAIRIGLGNGQSTISVFATSNVDNFIEYVPTINVKNSPTLQTTNSPPANATTPVLWIGVTNNGSLYKVPLYQ